MNSYKNDNTIKLKAGSIPRLITFIFDNSNYYEDFEINNNNPFYNPSEFEAILIEGFQYTINEDIAELIEILLNLYKFFCIQDIDFSIYCNYAQSSQFFFLLFQKIWEKKYQIIVPYFLQLCIEIIYKDNSHSFCEYCINQNAIEFIVEAKSSPEINSYFPILIIFSYNIFYFCTGAIINDTNEFDSLQKLCNAANGQYAFLSFFAMINLLRNTKIAGILPNKLFFSTVILAANSSNDLESESSLWCLYFWFKNNWENSLTFINKELTTLLLTKIKISQDLTHVKIALYIYSYFWLFNDDQIHIDIETIFPYDEVLQLIFNNDIELSSLAIINFHNFIVRKSYNLSYFEKKDGIKTLFYIAENGSIQNKIDAGLLLCTIFYASPKLLTEKYLTEKNINLLCDLLYLNDMKLVDCILHFLLILISDNDFILNIISNQLFLEFLTNIQEESNDENIKEISDQIFQKISARTKNL